MPRTHLTKERRDTKCYGLYFRSVINVRDLLASFFLSRKKKCIHTKLLSRHRADIHELGSRYIYELYYEKEAISKQLYDWLLKNKYADAALIAKWKKQGYEKVCLPPPLP